jgi:Tol biopolymer transport system component
MRLSSFGAALAALVLVSSCASSARAPVPIGAPPIYRSTRLEMPAATGFAVSHGGSYLLFSADANGTLNAYAAPLSGGDPTPLTSAVDADTSAVSYFSTDDRALIYVGAHLFVRLQDGTRRDLGAGLEFLGWRADGAVFYAAGTGMSGDTASLQGVFAFNAGTYARETLFSGRDLDAVIISRDNRWLGIERGDVLSLVDLTAPNAPWRQIEPGEPGDRALFEFSPSGRSIVYGVKAPGGFMEARRFDLATGETSPVMQAQADVTRITSSPTGRYAIYETHGAESAVAVIDQQTDRALPLSRDVRDVRFNRDESKVFFRLANDPWPQDIFISDMDGEHLTRLVHIEAARH